MIPAMTITMLVAALVVLAVVVATLTARAGLLLILTVIACSRFGATSEKTARKLAGNPQAVKARQNAEARMRTC